MTQYFARHGQRIQIGKKLGSGGEGAVYEVPGNSRLVAKIYHRPVDAATGEKLQAMTSLATDDVTRIAALPVSTLSRHQSGPVAGILMPRVSGHAEIHTLYSPAHRKTRFPDKDWAFLIHVAMNLAAAFDALHRRGIVIGDVNQGNILVSPRGTVTLIDCDSFQLESNGQLFPCQVGVAHFTPPELQGQSFHGVRRTIDHDLFGLAILIFHLICMGRHPYAGRFAGIGEPPSIEQAIEQFRYAYCRSGTTQLLPPPQTLYLPAVVPSLAGLFERAFLKGSELPGARPDEAEWHTALRELKSRLKPCASDVGHKYPNYLGNCPWCALERDGAPNFFASVTAHLVHQREGELTANLNHLWEPLVDLQRELRQTALAKVDFARLTVSATAIPAETQQNQAFAQVIGRVTLCCQIVVAATWWTPPLRPVGLALLIGFAAWWFVLDRYYGLRTERTRRARRLATSITTLRRVEHEAAKELETARLEFETALSRLELTKAEIEGLRPRYQADLDGLDRQRERRQLDAFLQSHLIREATIPMIGDARKSALESFGIETAFDINEIRILNIDGFGPTYVAALLDWKTSVTKRFQFQQRAKIPAVDRNTILAKYLRRREELENALISGRLSLELLVQQHRNVTMRFQQRLDAAALDAKQAEADAAILS